MRPDEVLLHELVHAAALTRGVESRKRLRHHLVNEGEFLAMLVANIYASETGRLFDLRKNYLDDYGHLTDDTGEKFLPNRVNYRYPLVSKLVLEQPGLAYELRTIDTQFNPIRRYFELERAAHTDRLK
jgi:hypothetical protein